MRTTPRAARLPFVPDTGAAGTRRSQPLTLNSGALRQRDELRFWAPRSDAPHTISRILPVWPGGKSSSESRLRALLSGDTSIGFRRQSPSLLERLPWLLHEMRQSPVSAGCPRVTGHASSPLEYRSRIRTLSRRNVVAISGDIATASKSSIKSSRRFGIR
jgi:hypothetical protein